MSVGNSDNSVVRDLIQAVADQKGITFEEALRAIKESIPNNHDAERSNTTMLVKELAAVVHQNAVDHGWWDEKQNLTELVALIHSEWSEALEEARAGRPLVWFKPEQDFMCCARMKCGGGIVGMMCEGPTYPGFDKNKCPAHCKPEGVAVELIDGCIRILDALGYAEANVLEPETGEQTSIAQLMDEHAAVMPEEMPQDVPTLIAWLHAYTSQTIIEEQEMEASEIYLVGALSLALTWVRSQGIDPLKLLLEKHEYNKGRPYKHGKKF